MYEGRWFFAVHRVRNSHEHNENFGGHYCLVGGIKRSAAQIPPLLSTHLMPFHHMVWKRWNKAIIIHIFRDFFFPLFHCKRSVSNTKHKGFRSSTNKNRKRFEWMLYRIAQMLKKYTKRVITETNNRSIKIWWGLQLNKKCSI